MEFLLSADGGRAGGHGTMSTFLGASANDSLIGTSGTDFIDGKSGTDTLAGGASDDVYVVDNAGDVVAEAAGEGTDTIQSTISIDLSLAGFANVENVTLLGTVSLNATGNTGGNLLLGNTAANRLDGGAGADSMQGAAGNDTYVVDNAGDVITEIAAGGTDNVLSSISYTLSDNVENITLTGSANINATGNALNNILTGNAGNNLLDGGAGADKMIGGLGDDTYVVQNASDVATETANAGTDTVKSWIGYTLGANLENVTLLGSANINATGNALKNILTGNVGANLLDGGAGADTITGGQGDDVYIVDNAGDLVTELSKQGTDEIRSSLAIGLIANVENYTFTGSTAVNFAGDDVSNRIAGTGKNDTLAGGAGNDTLVGGGGADNLAGGTGDDIYVIDNAGDAVLEAPGEGTDSIVSTISIDLSLAALVNIENATLLVTTALNANGNALNNVLIGNSANNVLDGGAGADTMIGGLGNDTYVVQNAYDEVTEAANAGTDTVKSWISYTLGDNVENLTLLGSASINGSGNDLNNVLTGNAGNNVLDGGAGADKMIGGLGNDTYVVQNVGDAVTEAANGGTDTVKSWIGYTLGSYLENLTLLGSANINATGNALSNMLTGNAGANKLIGGDGGDVMAGGAGNDTIDGGNGTDTAVFAGLVSDYQVTAGANGALIVSALKGTDGADALANIELLSFSDGTLAWQNGQLVRAGITAPTLTINPGTGQEDTSVALNISASIPGSSSTTLNLASMSTATETLSVVITGVPAGAALSAGTHNVDGSWTLTGDQLSGLSLIPATDYSGTIALAVNALAYENGMLVAQTIRSSNVTVDAVADKPLLSGTSNYSGQLDGVHSYVMPLDIAASVTDLDGSESLTVSVAGLPTGATLSAGKHNADGSWTLTSAMLPGLQLTLPTSVTSSFNFNVTATSHEASNGSTASVSQIDTVAITLAALSGKSIVGTSAANNLVGTTGSDTIDGKASADTMSGGAGNDTYYVDASNDKIVELAGGGTDTAIVSTQYALPDNVENMVITGTFAANRYTANALDNVITGSSVGNIISALGGNDTITGGADDDSIDGGAGADTAVYSGKRADYQITDDQFGNTIVTALNGTDGTDKLSNVETLQFADQTLQVAGVSSSGGGSSGGSSSGGSTPSSAMHAPAVVQPHNPGDVVGVQIQNNTDHADGPQLVTFGQAFVKGEVPSGTQLVALVDGQQIPVQVDVKTTNDDGSVRFAVITLQAPAIAAHGAVDVMLAKGTPAAQPDVQVGAILQHGYDLQLHLTMHNSDGTTTPLTINAANLLTQALQNGTAQTWLDGSLANEVRVSAPINQYLTATFDIRAYADGSVHTDVQVANTALYTPGNQSYTYDVAITEGGQTVFSDAGITHYKNANWHEEIWSNGKPDAHVVFDVDHLIASGAIQAYDTSIGINSGAIDAEVSKLAASDTGPLGSALVQVAMPTTGGRADIGPTTTWAATYLVSQDERAQDVMLANADAAGSTPWHFYDEATGRPVTVTDHPKLWFDPRGTDATYGSDAPANPINSNEGGWQLDVAHQPALTYVPYLVTGSHYYLDELEMQGAYSLAWYNPSYRNYDQGLVDSGQIRGMAWTMRTLSDAAFILPDGDPLKQYYVNELNNNLEHFVQKYVVDGALNAAGETEGWLFYGGEGGKVPAWESDFFSIALAEMTARGVAGASDFSSWMDNFLSGRFLNADNGFDPLHGTTYKLQILDPVTLQPYSTWQQIYEATFGASATPPTQLEGYPDSASGYAANAKASLASLITTTGSPQAVEAYGFIVGHTPNMPGAYASDPTWSVMPRLADGHYLHAGDMHVFTGSTGTSMTGTDTDELYYGGTGNDTIHGLNGIDLLFGDDGDDIIFGDAGNDYVFGGKGNDRIDGGTGDDYLKGGSGSNTFVFTTAGGGHDTIADFNPASDHLVIGKNINGSGITTATDVLAHATADAAGNAVLHLGGTDTVTLLGIHPEQITAQSIAIVQ